ISPSSDSSERASIAGTRRIVCSTGRGRRAGASGVRRLSASGNRPAGGTVVVGTRDRIGGGLGRASALAEVSRLTGPPAGAGTGSGAGISRRIGSGALASGTSAPWRGGSGTRSRGAGRGGGGAFGR